MIMRYQELSIQTQREAPNNARTPGFAFLVRAGYMTRESELLPLGEKAVEHLQTLAHESGSAFFFHLSLPILENENESYFPVSTGSVELIHCTACTYTARSEFALFAKNVSPSEEALPAENIATPECNTIDDLANFLGVSKEKTAKALLFTRPSDGKFIFAVVRGDMQLSEAKLKQKIGDFKPATEAEITASGAIPGYASPVGLKDALIIVDDLIPNSSNLVAGANEIGYHLNNVNYGRDYSAEIIADLVQAEQGHTCVNCGKSLSALSADLLATHDTYHFDRILHALAESYHDDKGLTLPYPAAAFNVYLMHVPGKTMDTRSVAAELYKSMQRAGISVLFDDRDDRAGVKFNDADLLGCPLRVTVGERGLQNGMVELKPRSATENQIVSLDKIVEEIQNIL